MRLQALTRKLHYWLSLVVALPVLVVIGTGLLLQVKKEFHWIQPDEQRGTPGAPRASFADILSACQALPDVDVRSWDDIDRVDLDPQDGLFKVTTHDNREIQIDAADGRVLQIAPRRSDLIEALHDGSWFGDFAKHWVFLPSGIVLLILWITGVYLFLVPQWKRRRRQPGR